MADEKAIESILVADCGTVSTKLLLLEKVEATYRFVAQAEALTTDKPPWEDITAGITHALETLQQTTGRILFTEGRLVTPREGIQGVDAFVVLLSASKPLHLILAGLVREMSLESAHRAAASTYAHIDTVLSREGSLRSPEETWARAVRDMAPDAIFLVGGVDGGASRPVMELADAIALGISMVEEEQRPRILYAGNANLRASITKLLGEIAQVDVVDNVRPTASTEYIGPAQDFLEKIFTEAHLQQVPGVDSLLAWSRLPVQPTAAAFGRVIEYLWHREGTPGRGVLGVDLGAANTTIAACFNGQLYLSVHGEQGTIYGPLPWVEKRTAAALLRWIPEEMGEEALMATLYNQELHPWTVPQDPQELWVAQAVIREMLRGSLRNAFPTWNAGPAASEYPGMLPQMDPILLSGGSMVHLPRPGQALLVALDGIQPVGISTILLDTNRAAPALGAVAGIKPLAAASALDAGSLISLGTVISPVGKARPGETVLKMKITYEDKTELNVEAHYGELEIWPLLPGQHATLELKPSRRFDLGMGGPGKGGKVEAIGGLVGLVVDARGRPLALPEDPERRRKYLRRWTWDVGG